MRAARYDAGSAVAEFVMVVGLLLALFGGVLQLGLVLHVRTVLVAAAQEGARVAASADRGPADGVARTRAAIGSSLGSGVLARTTVVPGTTSAAGAPAVVMTVRGTVPLLFWPAGPVALTVRGRALEEG